MNALANVFGATALIAGIASLLAYLGWLAVQVIGNINYLTRKGDDDDFDHRNRPR